MPVISRLRLADRRGRRTAIEVDGEPWTEVDTEVVLRLGLKKDQPFNEELKKRILAEDEFLRVRRAAAILLHTRPRAIRELRRLLAARRYSPESIERIVTHEIEVGGLDDKQFARYYARYLARVRQAGPLKIRMRLRQLGVEDRWIDAALEREPFLDTDEQSEAVRKRIEKALPQLDRVDPVTWRRRILSRIQRAGYDSELARKILTVILKDRLGHGENGSSTEMEDDLLN